MTPGLVVCGTGPRISGTRTHMGIEKNHNASLNEQHCAPAYNLD
jgi:hypothetical protein